MMDQVDLTADSREDVNSVSNIKLPAQLQKIAPAQEFVGVRHRWNTNEEIASILIAFDHHKEWLVLPQKIRPASGSMLLYNRKIVFYRRDGYCWKKRRNGSTIREDHMKLKVQGLECIYGSYVHSAILPTFHRRCYWLLQNPDIVLIHYLNVPYPEAAKPSIRPVSYELRSKEWSKEELVDQLRPMLSSVSTGMEHDVEKDQKLEKMLEEILLILMPLHEGSTIKPVLAEPKSLASEPFGPSPTVGEVSQSVGSPRNLAASTWNNQQQMIITHSQQKSQPSITSSTSIIGSSIGNSRNHSGNGSGQSILSVNGNTQGIVVGTGGHLLPQGMVMGNAGINTVPPPRLITIGGNQIVMANRSAASSSSVYSSCGGATMGQCSSNIGKAVSVHVQPRNMPGSSVKTETANSTGVSNTIISSSMQEEFHSTGVPVNNDIIPHKESQPRQLQLPSTVSVHQTEQDHPQGGGEASTPVLTLHLRPTNGSSSDSPGFVLSLQGATIVSQHNGLPSTSCAPKVSGTSSLSGVNPTNSPGGLVLVASQSPGGGLVLNKISPQPHTAPPGPYPAQLNTAPGAPSTTFATAFPHAGVSSCPNPGPNSVPVCETWSKSYNTSHMNKNATSHNLPFPPPCSTQGGNNPIFASHKPQTSLLNAISCGSTTRQQPLSSPTHNGSSKPSVINLAQIQTPTISCSSSVLDMNNRNIQPDKVLSANTSSFSHQVPSQPFIYSIPSTVDMEEVPTQCEPIQSQQQQQVMNQTDMVRLATKFEISQQQRFETISPPTVTSNDPTAGYVFNVSGQAILNTVGSSASFDSGKPSEKKACLSVEATRSDQLLASRHANTPLTRSSCFNEHFTKASALQGSIFDPSTNQQLNQPQNTAHSHLNLNHITLDSTAKLMAYTSSVVQTSKHMMPTPSSCCDTLDGSFSSLPSTDLNLDDLLDLNDLDDVSDLACSPFTPPDLTQQTADLDKVSAGSSHTYNTASLSSYCDTPTNSNQYLQQESRNQHLLLTVQQSPCPHTKHQAPSSPHHPGAPPRPLHSMSVCDTLASAHGASDPEINSVIKDFSPEWAYVKTNTKILIAGPWCSARSNYSCVFDGEHIPAMLVQIGLLRCYTQYHNPGYVTLQVARDGVIISNCEVFEFCDREGASASIGHPEWFAFDTAQLKLLLVQRLDQLRRRFVMRDIVYPLPASDDLDELESSLVQQVRALSGGQLSTVQEFPKAGQHNLTLLHLAAGLGFAKFISCLIRWRMATDCIALEFDVDAQSVDSHSCTPLTWACALGKIDAALTLYHWNAEPLRMCNQDGLLPLTLARQRGHYNLASQVEQLEVAKEHERFHHQQQQQEITPSTMDLSCSPGQSTSDLHSPSTITSDLGISLPPGSCSTPGDDTASLSVASDTTANGSFVEKDGAGMKYSELESSPRGGNLPTVTPPTPFPFSRPTKPGPKLVRRFSEQTIGHQSKTLSKRNSVDLLPSGQALDQTSLPGLGSPSPSLRDSSPSQSTLLLAGTGHGTDGGGGDERGPGESGGVGGCIASLPDMLDMAFVVPPAPRLTLEEKLDEPSGYQEVDDDVPAEDGTIRTGDVAALSTSTQMDTDEAVPTTRDSPLIDVERISSDEEVENNKDGSKHQMVTLANQIIAAIPERIKLSPSKVDDGEEIITGRGRSESHSSLPSQGSPRLSSFGDDSGISTPMTDSLAFDDYRYPELGTPSSSLSPESTCLPSPYSPYSFTLDSPPPTTAEFTEYFNAPTTYMEKDFSQLTLSDQEQRKLYEAAKVIQNAYRHYRDKQQQKEIEAAILIQSYYRRYKTYAYYKKMSQAAVLIQNQFRTYYARRKKRGDLGVVARRESERLKKGRNQSVIIQQRFRSHYQRRSFEGKEGSGPAPGSADCPDRPQQARPMMDVAVPTDYT